MTESERKNQDGNQEGRPQDAPEEEVAQQPEVEGRPDEAQEETDETVSPVVEDFEIPNVEDDEGHIARLEAEIADLKDKLLREKAETENVRRRTRKEKDDALKYAALPVFRDMATVADNLTRALESLPEGAESEDGPLANLVAGLRMTERELATTFERHGVVRIDPQGEKLDPHLHEAMFEVPDPTVPQGTVVQVVQPGYRLHDRLVRPARVGVAKGGPAPGNQNDGPAPQPGSQVDTEA